MLWLFLLLFSFALSLAMLPNPSVLVSALWGKVFGWGEVCREGEELSEFALEVVGCGGWGAEESFRDVGLEGGEGEGRDGVDEGEGGTFDLGEAGRESLESGQWGERERGRRGAGKAGGMSVGSG